MFQSILANLVAHIRGARWAMIVGADGVLLESSPPDLPDRDEIAAENALLYRSMRRSVAAKGDDLSSVALGTTGGKILFQDITPEYFLIVSLPPGGHSGKAAFEMARCRGALERELVF